MAVNYTLVCDFTDSGIAYVQAWRYDYGQRVQLIGENIGTTLTVQWHYNGVDTVDSRAITTSGGLFYANIPNDALEQDDLVEGYIYYTSGTEGNTVYKIELIIRDRPDTTEDGSEDVPPDTYFVIGNDAITAGTHTKITYDTQGLVTAGVDATLDDIEDGDTRKLSNYIAKTTNITSLNETGIADGEITVFNLTNKDLRTSNVTIATTLGADDTTVPTSKAIIDGIFAGYIEPVSAPTGTTRALDCVNYNVFNLNTFTAETTITFTAPASGTNCYSMTLYITQSASPQTINLPTIVWDDTGGTPTLTTASTSYILTLCTFNNGTTWFDIGRSTYTL